MHDKKWGNQVIKILVVEDEKIIADSIKDILAPLASVTVCYTGTTGFYEAKLGVYDLIVLDLMLPEMSGEELLVGLRKNSLYLPVLILSAKDGFTDKVAGFQNGADDYLTKPFHREELFLRVQALLRRSLGIQPGNELSQGALTVELTRRAVTYQKQSIDLIGKEFDLLVLFMQNAGQIVTKDQVFDRIWGFQSSTNLSVVEVYMSNLRKKLKPSSIDGWLKTIRNVGYLFKPVEEKHHG